MTERSRLPFALRHSWPAAALALALAFAARAQAPLPPLPPVPALPGTAPASAPGSRPRIDKAADLPRFSYAISGPVEPLLRSAQAFAPLAAAIRRDTESVLAGYDIPDKASRRDLINLLAVLDLLDGRPAMALQRAEQVRALQDKPADKLLSGLRLRAIASASLKHPPGRPGLAQAVATYVADELAPLPYPVVENDIKSLKAGAELLGEGRIVGRTREVLQPMVDANGALSSDFAPQLVFARYALQYVLPLKRTLVDAFSSYLARHRVEKADIWAARDVTLPADAGHRPVALAVWDSGVDTTLFPGQLLRDADGGVARIAFDKYARPSEGALMPLPVELKARLPLMIARTKGLSDLQSNIDSPEASSVKQLLAELPPEQYRTVVEELGLAGNYEHGTHVAGIALAGNPFARLVVARIGFGHTLKPDPCPTLELTRRDAANAQATVDFFKRHGVRVVNMSWGGSISAIENELEQCAPGQTAAQRKALAREMYDIGKQALTDAFASAPAMLFVTSAGNSNSDASFVEDMPADIVLPNLLTVGAVDRAGDEAPFTSYGPTVRLHANGYQVESTLPGGARVALSGTSMAAPQVAGLAAKLLAVRPGLTPEAVITLMTRSADRSADGRRVLMNPKAALAAALASDAGK